LRRWLDVPAALIHPSVVGKAENESEKVEGKKLEEEAR